MGTCITVESARKADAIRFAFSDRRSAGASALDADGASAASAARQSALHCHWVMMMATSEPKYMAIVVSWCTMMPACAGMWTDQ